MCVAWSDCLLNDRIIIEKKNSVTSSFDWSFAGVLALEIFRNFIARACTRLADVRLNGRKRYADDDDDDDDLEGKGEDFIISGITEESITCMRVCYTRVKNLLKISYVCVCLYAYVTSVYRVLGRREKWSGYKS